MFNNPMYYNNFFPYQNNLINQGGLLKRGLNLLGNHSINWSNILNNTQKTLNVINQAIPVYYQIKPIYQNAKTMFRMMNALKDNNDDQPSSKNEDSIIKNTNQQGPVFFQ